MPIQHHNEFCIRAPKACGHFPNRSLDGGRAAMVLFSMTASCKRHGIDPSRYLADVLWRLPTTAPHRLTELLPDVWLLAHPQPARKRAV